MSKSHNSLGAVTAIAGAILLFVGTLLHPSNADPNDFTAAFTEYGAFQAWFLVHLTQLTGLALIAAALVLLTRRLMRGPAAEWALLAGLGAVASLAVYAALQAVDGVALKGMVDSWLAAPASAKEAPFQAALAVRHIEIGLTSIFCLLIGVTAVLYGLALLLDGLAAKWIGVVAILGGAPTAFAGVVIAYTGFSDLALIVNMVASTLLMVWMVALGVCALRGSPFWRAA